MHEGATRAAIDLVDDNKLGSYQFRVIALCAVIALLDGFDTQAIGFVAPVISSDWRVALADFGLVFAIGLAGGLLGALMFGAVADRKGRRLTLLATVVIFAMGSLLTATSSTLFELGIWRFVTGLGLGGAMPSIIALASEFSPKRKRATLVVAMFCGFPLGALFGALISAPLIERFSWPSVFLAGGVLPLLLLPLLYWQLPESVDWLIARGRRPQADAIVAKMGKEALPAHVDILDDTAHKGRLTDLFAGGRAGGSLLLAVIFFLSLLLVFLLVSWIPAVAVEAGHSVRAGVLAAGLLNLTGIIGGLVIAAASDRLGSFRVVGTAYVLGAAGIGAVAVATEPGSAVFLFCALSGLFCIGAQLCAVSIASQFYPAELRGTGVGFAMGMGRLGAIAGPLIGAALIGDKGGASLVWLVAILSAGAGVAVLLMGLLYRGPRSGSPAGASPGSRL